MKLVLLLLISGMVTFNPEEIRAYSENTVVDGTVDDQRGTPSMIWDGLLQKYVTNDGVVDYKGLKEDPSFQICVDAYSNMAMNASWDQRRRLAYWINVYNVFTVKLILDNYPLKSITDLKEPWKQKFIKLDGKMYSLNQIENEIIRPKFKDARVHFAINCGSFSCPRLNNRAFFGHSLDKILTQLTKDFLKDTKRNKITTGKAEVSKIFEWYAEDFTAGGSTIESWINRYSLVKIADGTKATYMEYDWSLNGK